MRARTSCQNTTAPKTQTTSPTTPHFQRFHQSGLRFGRHTASSRGLAVANRGNCTTRASDTPTTRRQKASCSAKPPRPPVRRAPEDPEGRGARLRRPWAAAGLGRASRRRAERSSRRGRLAGGPPPMGTQNSPAETTVRGPLHPLRGGTPDQKGCNAYGSGAAHPITRTNAESARQPPTHTRPRELALPGPSAFSDHQPAFNNRRSVVTNHRSAANSPSTIINRRSADTPRRAVAAIRDGNASGGQPVA